MIAFIDMNRETSLIKLRLDDPIVRGFGLQGQEDSGICMGIRNTVGYQTVSDLDVIGVPTEFEEAFKGYGSVAHALTIAALTAKVKLKSGNEALLRELIFHYPTLHGISMQIAGRATGSKRYRMKSTARPCMVFPCNC
jgi:hypothetical protein